MASRLLFYAPEMAAYGGMERHICLLAIRCAAFAKRILLITTSNSLKAEARDELKKAGVQLCELPLARGRAPKSLKYLWLTSISLWLRREKWDVIYSNGQSGLAKLVWLAGGKRTIIVHHHHTSADQKEQATWHPAFKKVLADAERLVSCSHATKTNLQNALDKKGITYLPYLTPELLASDQVHESHPAEGKSIRIGFLGRLVNTKGIETICQLSLAPELHGVKWQIHGSGGDYAHSFFKDYPNVIYHGSYGSAEDCARILRKLDAVALYSSHNEGMPLSLIEAMSAGLPWIATDQGGVRELAVAGENCEIVPATADFETIKKATLSLILRIRSGGTSKASQRAVYDRYFAPAISAKLWMDYLGVLPES